MGIFSIALVFLRFKISTMKKKIGLGLLAIIVIIQFIRIDKENPAYVEENDFIYQMNPPEHIEKILRTSCYDCHSSQTKYPWYSNVAPISWWLSDHIEEARGHLNFSDWETYELKRKEHKLEECVDMLEAKEMPLSSYLITHGDAELSAEELEELVDWFKSIDFIPKETPKKTLQLNNGEKWEANAETTAGIAKMKDIVVEDIEDGRISHYAAMGQRLNIELQQIFNSCNMTGPAHDQLHIFIMPLVNICNELEVVEEEEEAMILQKNILKQINKYTEFFQTSIPA